MEQKRNEKEKNLYLVQDHNSYYKLLVSRTTMRGNLRYYHTEIIHQALKLNHVLAVLLDESIPGKRKGP